MLRNDLLQLEIVSGEIEAINSNKINKKLSKADIIRYNNNLRKIKSEFSSLLQNISNEITINRSKIVFSGKFIELIIIKMMIHCKNLIDKMIDKQNHHQKISNSKFVTDEKLSYKKEILLIGYTKFIEEKKLNIQLSKTCLEDLEKWINKAKQIIKYDSTNVIIHRPKFIFKTIYDEMLQKKNIDLYPSQKDIFKFVTENNSYLALVHTMLASGKTTMVLPLCGWLATVNIENRAKIIFCCPNEAVLLEVGRMIYGIGIPFGIVIRNIKDGSLIYKWSTFVDQKNPEKTAILYLCDIFVARILLEQRQGFIVNYKKYMDRNKIDPINFPIIGKHLPKIPDYILIGDELTKDADSREGFENNDFSVNTELFIDLMKIIPPRVILMSATLPTIEQFPEYHKIAKNNMIIKSFTSSEATIGCALISNKGKLFAPHFGAKTIDEIKNMLNIIQTNPFIGRFYTFEILLDMVSIFNKYELITPILKEVFDDPSKATQNNIQNITYEMLNTLINSKDNKLVEKISNIDNQRSIGTGVNLSTIFTTDFNKFCKGCIIYSNNPMNVALEIYRTNFDSFLIEEDKKNTRNIFHQIKILDIIEKHQKELENYNKIIKRMKSKSDDGIIKSNKEHNKKERMKTNSWEQLAKVNESYPIWDFPKELQLGSIEHLCKCEITSKFIPIASVMPEDLPIDSNVSSEILTLLASGIGIYSTSNNFLDDAYLKSVLLLAKRGLLRVIFSDGSIAYGTNLSVSNIIIIDELKDNESIVTKHSIKTIFQMLGRAGRGGDLSYVARIYTTSHDDALISIIQSYIKGTLDEGTRDEVTNIRKAFETIW